MSEVESADGIDYVRIDGKTYMRLDHFPKFLERLPNAVLEQTRACIAHNFQWRELIRSHGVDPLAPANEAAP